MNIAELMNSACDKTKAPAYHNEFWTITQAELERFTALVLAAHTAKLLAGVEMPEPVGRTMRFIGNDDYARKHSYCARTYDELPRGVYSGTWQDLGQLYTQDQLQQYAAAAAQSCCKEKMELENFLQELSKQSGWASTVIRKYLNEMSSKEK